MIVTKYFKSIAVILFLCLLLIGCTSNNEKANTFLTETNGVGLTFSEYFKGVDNLDDRENVVYYKPFPISEIMTVAPESIRNAVNIFESDKLPFEVNEKTGYLITSKDENGNLQNQVQFSYLNNPDNRNTKEFFIISVIELKESPLHNYDFSKEGLDTIGNELRKETLTDDIPMFHQVITTNRALVFKYYSYNVETKRVGTVATQANELYGYYKGHIYHVGYSINGNNTEGLHEQMLQLTREFILGETM